MSGAVPETTKRLETQRSWKSNAHSSTNSRSSSRSLRIPCSRSARIVSRAAILPDTSSISELSRDW